MRVIRAVVWAALLIVPVLAGCADSPADEPEKESEAVEQAITDVRERAALPFNMSSDQMSRTLEEGPFGILEPVSVFVDIDLPPTEGGAAIDPTNPPRVHLGVIMPDIPGCDFSDLDTEVFVTYDPQDGTPEYQTQKGVEGCKVPVVADAGPYWGESDVPADERGSGRLGETLIQNLVPHGYAVAQISVFGSGQSNHCFDMFGLAEQLGVAGAVEWLGDQGWSNGNVGLIGRSYDGSTPWMAAAHAPEALKTIVPISGLSGLGDLVTWNGASETRVLLFQNVIYGTFGVPGPDPASAVRHRATCPDWMSNTGHAAAGYAAGGEAAEGDYWEERNFVPEVLQNYEGSVYLIHGLLDNNVDPHAGWLAHQAMIDKGLDTKGLYGQWYHSYPDRFSEHGESGPSNSVRFDWAQDLLEWFDHYLKGSEAKPPLHIEVQQDDGRWRLDDSLQPSAAEVLEVPVDGSGTLTTGGEGFVLDLGVLDEDNETLLGGLSQLDLNVAAGGPASQIYIELFDATDGETFGLSYGITRLDRAVAGPENPGTPGVYTIPLQYFAGSLPAGHSLGLRIDDAGNDYLPSPDMSPTLVGGAGSVLRLSTIPSEAAEFFEVPERPSE